MRVQVFEYSLDDDALVVTRVDQLDDDAVGVPLVMLFRHRKKHYNNLFKGNPVHPRPLGLPAGRASQEINIRKLRVEQEIRWQLECVDGGAQSISHAPAAKPAHAPAA